VDDAHSDGGMSAANHLSPQIFKNTSLTEDKNFFMDDGAFFIGFWLVFLSDSWTVEQ
jgi:hypothetical protein